MSSGHRAIPRRAVRLPRGRRTALVLGIGIAALGLWMGVHVVMARADLVAAQGATEALQNAVASGDSEVAASALVQVQQSTRAARASLNDPTLVLASHVPVLGRNIMAPRQVAAIPSRMTAAQSCMRRTAPALRSPSRSPPSSPPRRNRDSAHSRRQMRRSPCRPAARPSSARSRRSPSGGRPKLPTAT